MGFKYKEVTNICGNEDFPAGNEYENRRFRSETIVSKVAQAIIDCNVGWQLDTNRNNTITDYTDIPTKNNDEYFPGLLMVNTTSNCKLFVTHFATEASSHGIKDFSGNDLFVFSGSSNKNHAGLCTSMIPDASDSEFGDPNTNTFIPEDATRISGTCFYTSTIYADSYNPSLGNICAYSLYVSPYTIVVGASHTKPAMNMPVYACGRIFGYLAHPDVDTSVNAKYGLAMFRRQAWGSSAQEGWVDPIRSTIESVFGTNNGGWVVGQSQYGTSDGYSGLVACGAIAKADGTWSNGLNGSNCVEMYVSNALRLNDTIYNTSGNKYWLPIGMYSIPASTNGIIAGDAYKGDLDTGLFRAMTLCDIGTKYGNESFISPETNRGIVLGWDPSNEDPLIS